MGYAPGLVFWVEAGVRNVNNFRTLVRGFIKILGDVHLVFRYTLLGFRGQFVGSVFKRRRFYMICSDSNLVIIKSITVLHDKVAIQQLTLNTSQHNGFEFQEFKFTYYKLNQLMLLAP
jgi:hypothetical protein